MPNNSYEERIEELREDIRYFRRQHQEDQDIIKELKDELHRWQLSHNLTSRHNIVLYALAWGTLFFCLAVNWLFK